jgi:hypothetical protein
MANRDELDRGTGPAGDPERNSWTTEDEYWRTHFASRPYAQADRSYEFYRPGYRYGVDAANRFRGRRWEEAESDIRSGWDRFEHRAQATWDNVKDAVHDAWDRITGDDRNRGFDRDRTRPTY